jgi:anti-anti-sigma regulatory factor
MDANYHLVRFEGALDISRYPEFRKVFEELPLAIPALVDLTDIEAVDSIFLSEMMLARRRHTAPFAILIAPLGSVARVFGITGLDRRAYVFSDLAQAVASLGLAPETKDLAAD